VTRASPLSLEIPGGSPWDSTPPTKNRTVRCGDVVRIVTTEDSDARPVDDIFWPHEDDVPVYGEARQERRSPVERPLAVGDEGITWSSGLAIAPWAICLPRRSGS